MQNKQVFIAENSGRALSLARRSLGPKAVIISSHKIKGGIKIIAALQNEAPQETEDETSTTYDSRAKLVDSNNTESPEESKSKQEKLTDALIKQGMPKLAKLLEEKQSMSLGNVTVREKANPEEDASTHLSTAPEVESPEDIESEKILEKMEYELGTLRDLLKSQLTECALASQEKNEPTKAMLSKYLLHMGMDQTLSNEIAKNLTNESGLDAAIATAKTGIQELLETTGNKILKEGGIVALIGPTGVGKTTTIAKLATGFVLENNPDELGLISTDSQRIAAREQLNVYAQILGISVYNVSSAKELQSSLEELKDKKLVLIDTSGVSQFDTTHIKNITSLITSSKKPIHSYLVMAATNQSKVSSDVINKFKASDLSGVILTKIDETHFLGPSLSALIQHKLPVAYLSKGQRIPEDLETATSKLMTELLFYKSNINNPTGFDKTGESIKGARKPNE